METVSWIAGQPPWVASWILSHFGLKQFSLYQNLSIYQGNELFIIVPIVVGLFATWIAFRIDTYGMILVLMCFIILTVVVIYIRDHYPDNDKIHSYNWFLFYCLPALGGAIAGRLLIFLWNYISATAPGSAVQRFQEDFGDATSAAFQINHNLHTLDVIVRIISTAPNNLDITPDRIERISIDSIRVVFASPPGLIVVRAILIA
jgi:hypothetical protein